MVGVVVWLKRMGVVVVGEGLQREMIFVEGCSGEWLLIGERSVCVTFKVIYEI